MHHQPFTYLIKHIPSGKVYYGLRYAKGCKPADLWTTYFTSSKDIQHLIDTDGIDSFEYQIRKVFTDPLKAIEWEKRVLKKMNAIYNESFINRSIPGSSMFCHSEETKEKLRKPKPEGFAETLKGNKRATVLKGVPKSKEHAENISKGKKGKAPFKGEKHPRYGTKKSKDELDKISETKRSQARKWMNNGIEAVFVCSKDIELYESRGYTLGRGKIKKDN